MSSSLMFASRPSMVRGSSGAPTPRSIASTISSGVSSTAEQAGRQAGRHEEEEAQQCRVKRILGMEPYWP
jgi:hypothetical protein